MDPTESRQMFSRLPKGGFDEEQFAAFITNLGVATSAISALFAKADADSNGLVDETEFAAWLVSSAPNAIRDAVSQSLSISVVDIGGHVVLTMEVSVVDDVSYLRNRVADAVGTRSVKLVHAVGPLPQQGTVLDSGLKDKDVVTVVKQLLCFTSRSEAITLGDDGLLATAEPDGELGTALCRHLEMTDGVHFVEMCIVEDGGYAILLGIVGPDFDETAGCACEATTGWMYDAAGHGQLYHNGADEADGHNWDGMEPAGTEDLGSSKGAVIGLELNLEDGSLTVYKNGSKLGLMVTGGLKGPFCWCVDIAKATIRLV